MSLLEDVRAAIDDWNRKREQWRERATEIASKHLQETAEKVYEQFGNYQIDKITKIFNYAMQKFYDAYEPLSYLRTGSLFGLLEIKTDKHGLADYDDALDLINPDNMHRDRHGNNSLFETVFMEGWHGGAKSISSEKASVWGEHPNPGVPYYRTASMVRYPDNPTPRFHPFGAWGERAEQTDSPYALFKAYLQEAEDGELAHKWQEISSLNWKKLCENLQRDLSELRREIYS